VAVTIADEGCGLSTEAWERLFTEPFFTTKPRHQGLGLGTVFGILRCHQGGLILEPRLPRGTVVQLYLPAASAPTPSSLSSVAQDASQRVLVVDDDPMILQLVCTTLKRAGYQVEAAMSAAEALQCYGKACAEPFCLVLSDVAMPRMDGLELAHRLQTQNARVNILFMSGQMVGGLADQDFCGRKFDLLIKPFRPDGLLRAVRSAMERAVP
jgi:CheY-like chemotaxis protein